MADTFAKIVLTAEDKTASAMASLRNGLADIDKQAISLRGVFDALVPASSVAGILSFVKNTNDGIDALNDLKDATGASIENISALEDIAGRTGTSFDTVGAALIKFNGALNDAKPDSDVARALKAIGLEAQTLKQLDPAEALRRTAVALGDFADDGNKARLVQELFGKSLREVAPLLNDLKEKGSLVAKVTTEQAEEAEKFNKQLFELEKNAKDAGRALVSDLVTGLNAAGKAYRESGLIAGIQTFLTGDDQYKNNKALVEDTEKLLRLENELVRFKEQGYKDGSRVVENLKAQIEQTKEALKITMGYRQALAQAAATPTSAPTKSVGAIAGKKEKSPAEEISDARRETAAYVKQLQGQLDTVGKISEVEQAKNFLASQGLQGQIPQVRELVLGLAAQADQEKKIADVLRQQTQLQKEIDDAYRNRLQSMLGSGPKAQLEKTREDIQLLTAEFEEGRISEEQYLDAVTGRLNLVADGVKNASDNAREFGFIFNSAFEDAVINGKELGDVIQALGQDIARIALRKTVTEPLGNAVGSFFGSLFSFDGGGSTGSGSRSGGLDGKGGFLAVMHPQETVIDHTRVGSAGSQPIVQNFNFNGPADRAQVITAAQLGAAMARDQARDDRARGRA